jgi:transcriptional regulator with XRE-family HTH domain
MTPFGAKLRELRADRNMTLAEMAANVGVSSAYLSALEHGKRGRPSWHLVQSIISYLNIIWDEAEELVKLSRLSHPKITIDTAGLDPDATELANRLSKSIAKLDKSTVEDLLRRLKSK